VQNPGEQPEAALVLIGDEGTGKGLFFRALKRCFGQHGVQISNIDHLTGRFNKHLIDKCFLFADEIDWQRSKKDEGTFLRVVTEPTIFIEPKNIDSIEWPNRLHIGIASNKQLIVPAGPHARRWVINTVDNRWSLENASQAERNGYFRPLFRQMDEGGGCEAMLFDLLAMDLETWHPRNIVLTDALADQKQQNLDPDVGWLQDILLNGILPGDENGIGITPVEVLFESYLERATKGGGYSRRSNSTKLGMFLTKYGVTKTNRTMKVTRTVKGGSIETRKFRGAYEFPELQDCRVAFEKLTGTKPRWTDPEGAWEAEEIDYERPDNGSGIGLTRGYR
jgi:hypothetical protein